MIRSLDGSIMEKHTERDVMSRFRSISYAPWSTEDFYGTGTSLAPQPEWTLCRKYKELPIQDNSMLRSWTARGRVLPSDYLVHRELDVCVQARDIAELGPVFRKARLRRLARICIGLGLGAAMLLSLAPLLASAVLVAALILAGRSSRMSRPHEYRLSTAGEHGTTLRPAPSGRMSTMRWSA